MSVAPARVVVFAEDSAWWARDVLRALLVEMVRGLWRPPGSLDGALEFVADEEIGVEVHRLSVGCAWKDKRTKATSFVRSLTDLLRAGCIVVVHFDADCLWSERHKQDENGDTRAKFRRLIFNRLKESPPAPDWRERLLLFVPHDELEAWLFQNTEAVRVVLRAAGRLNPGVEALLSDWAKDRAALDRTKSPKDQLRSPQGHILVETLCLVPLAEAGFPTAEVRALGTSYAYAMAGVRRCQALRQAVQRATKARRRAEAAQAWRGMRQDPHEERP